MTLQAPASVQAASSFQASYSFRHDKSGGVVAVTTGGAVFSVAPFADQEQMAGVLSSAPISGSSGTVTLTAPQTPGSYNLQTIYGPDGGTLDVVPLQVTAAAASASAPAAGTPAAPGAGTPAAPGAGATSLTDWLSTPGALGLPHGLWAAVGAIGAVYFLRR